MVADLVKQDMADVTIYGSECEFCGEGHKTVDNLVRHLVNEHDQLWNYEKPVEESLKCIKLDKKLLRDINGKQLASPGSGSIKCKFCEKSFRILDGLAQHVMFDHPPVAVSAYKYGGIYLSAEFLAENFVENFEEYCRSQSNGRSQEQHLNHKCEEGWFVKPGLSDDWEEIDSADEWELQEASTKCENEVKDDFTISELTWK